jgi:chromosome partitioning protein
MVPVDNEEGNVAARSRALFEQLRSLRSKAPANGPPAAETTREPAPETSAEAPQPGEVTPAGDGQNGGLADGVPSPSGDVDADVSASGHGPTLGAGAAVDLAVVEDAREDRAATMAPELSEDGAGPASVEDHGGRHPAADLPLPRVIAIANQKGGVGKTTTAVNLGAALAELGYRTLIIDLDPQGNATTGLGVNARNLEHAIYDVLMHDLPLDECVEPTSVRNLFVAPATIDLAGAEIELVPAFSRELRLRRAIAEMGDDYEYTIIDCPPSLGLLTVNGLAAATEVIVPIQCEYYALEGLSQLLRNVSLVQSNLNPPLIVSAIILTMYDARTKLADQVAGEVRLHFGAKVCRNVVPRTVRLSEAPSFGQPIIVFDSSSRGALAYRELAKEVSGGAPQRVG